MASPRFFVDTELSPGVIGTLDIDQSRQARSVLRLGAGSALVVCNGTGIEAAARIVIPVATSMSFEVLAVARPNREPPAQLTVGLAFLKGDKFEIAVQKLTELGVAAIVPLLTERSVISFDDARGWTKRLERYRRIAREAAEQSERVTLPEIASPVPLMAFLANRPVTVLLERAQSVSITEISPDGATALAIGPEGGWSLSERTLIEQHALRTASLGPLILRAETAAIVAAAALIQRAWATKTN
jgi:16S rRNA (uracil1498-N3)-methyltransferase